MSNQEARLDQIERQILIDRNATSALLKKQDEMLLEQKNTTARLDRIESLLQLMLQSINEINASLKPQERGDE
jgi:hypothetical protein